MTGEDYYYMFSIIVAVTILLHIINMIYFRVHSRTLFGQKYKAGSIEQKALSKFATYPYLPIALGIAIIAICNLAYAIYRIASLNAPHSRLMLFFIPTLSAVVFIATFITIHKQLNTPHKNTKD